MPERIIRQRAGERELQIKEKIGEVFSVARDNPPIPGCTISREITEREQYVAYYSLAAGTDISAEIYTYHKLLFVNHGDSPNKLSLVIGGRELTGQAALVYATLAVRVCRVVSTDGSDTPDSAPAVEVGEWFYLCDFCTLAEGVASFGSVTPFGDYLLPGVEDLATSGDTSGSPSGDLYGTGAVENVCDLWLQVELLPCAELEQNEKFKALNITEAPYQAMQGMDNAFELNFSVFFEVDV